jgi:hypothetical protein
MNGQVLRTSNGVKLIRGKGGNLYLQGGGGEINQQFGRDPREWLPKTSKRTIAGVRDSFIHVGQAAQELGVSREKVIEAATGSPRTTPRTASLDTTTIALLVAVAIVAYIWWSG